MNTLIGWALGFAGGATIAVADGGGGNTLYLVTFVVTAITAVAALREANE